MNPHRFNHRPHCSQSAFTMVEIAISLAIIGFALVAIIGILPAGLTVQKENREETIINQDANYLMDAIRGGARGTYDLSNYFDQITVTNRFNNVVLVANPNDFAARPETIVGLLSRPSSLITGATNPNPVVAYVRAISGAAADKPPQNNTGVRDMAFSYRLTSVVAPYSGFDTNATNFAALIAGTPEWTDRLKTMMIVTNLQNHLYEVRLKFEWPVLGNGRVGANKATFRTMLSGQPLVKNLASSTPNLPSGTPLYFFQQHYYTNSL